MNLDLISVGKNPPEDINVVIEISGGSSGGAPIKYELEKESGALFVDRVVNTSMFYPCNYGFVPKTIVSIDDGGDGDAIDIIILSQKKFMKNLLSIAFAIIFSLSIYSQRNPNSEYWINFVYQPKKGMVEEFEKAVAEKTQKYNNSSENAIFAFQIMTGSSAGAYQRWVVRKDVSYFEQDSSDELKYWNDNVDPYIAEKSGQRIWQRSITASHGWEELNGPMKYYSQQVMVVKRGKNGDFMTPQRRLAQLFSDIEFTGNRAVFKLVSGGNNQTFMIMSGFNTHDRSTNSSNLPDGKSWEDAYNEKFGENAWSEDWSAQNEAIETWGSNVSKMQFRPELSTKL